MKSDKLEDAVGINHKNPKMETTEVAKLAMGGMPRPVAGQMARGMRVPRRPMTPRAMPAANPMGTPVMKKGGKMHKKDGGLAKDPAATDTPGKDFTGHKADSKTGGMEMDGGFKRGGRMRKADGGLAVTLGDHKDDEHVGKKIGSDGDVTKKYKSGGHVKGHKEVGHKHSKTFGHGSHGHSEMKKGGMC